ncbi:hypothetical protein [Streptomyces netropsis]|uniref:Uncharacterized protein n=1 Tax=Streptomyces netropsis TaxID=55404 RepID=A0A7W7PGA9_STRNE|nr:hypothetical protein [Streptomyces netropsis]MBB4888647.1 hypothetical protein [Streptomyces netropsis]
MPIARRWAALALTAAALVAATTGPSYALSSALRRSPARRPRDLSLRV